MAEPPPPFDLDPDITTWIASVTSMDVVAARQIPAGGRMGWFVDVDDGDHVHELFLQIGRGLESGQSSFQGFEVEAEVYRALRPHALPVPKVWGVDAERDVLLVDRIPGSVWFQAPNDPAEQVSVAQDFIGHLATWHRLGAAHLDLPSLGPVQSWRAHQTAQLDGIEAMLNTTARGRPIDPLVTEAMRWLRANIPHAEGPVVLVQGDTGPGNFLYQDGKVTGIIDWELAHLGDPMDDIAWLSWRTTQHSFTHFPDRLREYETLSGIEVDPARVRYYRLNAFGRLGPLFGVADMGLGTPLGLDTDEPQAVNRAADGSALILSTLHRRMRLEATADAMGFARAPRAVEEAPEPAHAPMYDHVLEQLRDMVPRIEDRTAANGAKAIARQLKYLRELDRNGELFDAQELDDLGRLLGERPVSAMEGRRALVDAVHGEAISFEAYLDYHWRRLRRDDHLMRHASGALYERGWPDLT
jgi:aminoglycoside phosphotransferase